MAKSKTYTYDGKVPGMIVMPGRSPINVEPGDTVEAESDADAAAFDANPDLSSGTRAKKKDKDD